MIYSQQEWVVLQECSDQAEFDWFGVDAVGNIGVFCSFGIGPVPKKIWSSLDLYNELYEVIENLPEVTESRLTYNGEGSYSDWLEYASKGLFAYDYHDAHRTKKLEHYDLIAIPESPIQASDLKLNQYLIKYLPMLEVEFSVAGNIKIERIL